MNLTTLYSNIAYLNEVESIISRNLLSSSYSRFRGYWNIKIEVRRNNETLKLLDYLEKNFNRFVEQKTLRRIKLKSFIFEEPYYLVPRELSTTLVKEEDYYEYWNCINLKFIAKKLIEN